MLGNRACSNSILESFSKNSPNFLSAFNVCFFLPQAEIFCPRTYFQSPKFEEARRLSQWYVYLKGLTLISRPTLRCVWSTGTPGAPSLPAGVPQQRGGSVWVSWGRRGRGPPFPALPTSRETIQQIQVRGMHRG